MSQLYKRPPITEAVIELRFEQGVTREAIEKTARRLDKLYVFSDPEEAVNLAIDIDPVKTQVNKQWFGVRLSSIDRSDATLLRTQAFACSRLAPYQGWESLRSRAERDWGTWKAAVGYSRISRVGVRFINRLDIPVEDPSSIPVEDFITLQPRLPALDLPPMSSYTMQVVQPLGVDQLSAMLSTATIPSLLLDHASFVLDIDVFRDSDVPQRDDDLWALIEQMRGQKNRLFESCVTDEARVLFQK